MINSIKETLRNYEILDRLKKNILLGPVIKKFNTIKKNRNVKQFHKYGLKCLEKTSAAFTAAGVNFWLDYGTLLGAVREKDFIGHDSDLDIGVFYEERNKDIEQEMKKQGIKKIREFIWNNKILLETYCYKGVDLDIFYYFCDGNKIWSYTFDGTEGLKSKNSGDVRYITGFKTFKVDFVIAGFDEILFKGSNYKVPTPVQSYLSAAYGAGFMIKDKNWDVTHMGNRTYANIDDTVCKQYL